MIKYPTPAARAAIPIEENTYNQKCECFVSEYKVEPHMHWHQTDEYPAGQAGAHWQPPVFSVMHKDSPPEISVL